MSGAFLSTFPVEMHIFINLLCVFLIASLAGILFLPGTFEGCTKNAA